MGPSAALHGCKCSLHGSKRSDKCHPEVMCALQIAWPVLSCSRGLYCVGCAVALYCYAWGFSALDCIVMKSSVCVCVPMVCCCCCCSLPLLLQVQQCSGDSRGRLSAALRLSGRHISLFGTGQTGALWGFDRCISPRFGLQPA